ncbi:MAG: MFS transporter [Bacteriovoracaceae bacterium]|jgi:predicted MFS family arabinose efflux permease|nr:MFS transporter [Bacteriovoracaceae bacterium]
MTFRLQKTPEHLLYFFAFIMPFTFSVWQVLLNNYVVDYASFTGKEIGFLQSIREIPGLLAFASIYLLLFFKEQSLAIFFLALMCIGVGATGCSDQVSALYGMTFIMSVGFHYFETMNQSLTLQWIPKEKLPTFMGELMSLTAIGSILSYSLVWILMTFYNTSYKSVYLSACLIGLFLLSFVYIYFPQFKNKTEQRKKMILRKKYWLYYVLTFLSGARRQIFMVFAGFMMVEKFGYSVQEISILYIGNYAVNIFLAPKIGNLITQVGEKNILTFEYLGLVLIFSSYSFVENKIIAAVLYVLDHMFFGMAMALKTYFQKIANPEDIASTAGISFTINHIAAVIIPALFGFLWLKSPSLVFGIGAGMSFCSFLFSRMIKIEH